MSEILAFIGGGAIVLLIASAWLVGTRIGWERRRNYDKAKVESYRQGKRLHEVHRLLPEGGVE